MVRAEVGIGMEQERWWWLPDHSVSLPHLHRYAADLNRHRTMPSWPTAEGRRTITLEVDAEHVAHLDAQANYEGCSRAAYLRQLIRRDIERQGPARRTASATA